MATYSYSIYYFLKACNKALRVSFHSHVRGARKSEANSYTQLPKAFVCFFLTFVASSMAFGEGSRVYEIVSTPFSSSKDRRNPAIIISQNEIEEFQEITLKDALPYNPSVVLNAQGVQGRQVDFSIRGARSAQNLVLVDEIYVSDPASGGTIDLSNFLNADLERIEVLPGPHALAYGPGALGGVIRLVPKRGHGKPSLKVRGEGGSFHTKYGSATAQGEEGPFQFLATAAGFKRGPSPFTNSLHGNRQGDKATNGTFSSRIGYALTENWEIEGIMRYSEGKTQFDDLTFSLSENTFLPFEARNFSNTQTLLSSLESKWGTKTVDHSLKATYSRIQRKTDMPTFQNKTLGEHPLLSYKAEVKMNSKNTLLAGFQGGQERAKEPDLHKRSHGGVFLIHYFKPFDWTSLKGGIRADRFQSIGNRITFNVGVDQNVTPTTTLHASYGTNFRPPILSDLFVKENPWQLPNPHLKPEKSQSFEAGAEQLFYEKKLRASLVGFLTRIDQITLSHLLPSGQWQRFNGGKRITRGVEMSFSFAPLKELKLKSALTLMKSRDNPGNKKSPLIPGFKGAGGIHWQAFSDLSFFIHALGVSSKRDAATQKKISSFGIIHIGGAYDLNRHAGFFWRIENLTNKHYEEVFGYGMRGRAFYVGIEAKT